MRKILPEDFLKRLKIIIPPGQYDHVRASFLVPTALSVRINTLKISKQQLCELLTREHIEFKEVPWAEEALVFEGAALGKLKESEALEKNYVYRQGLSSMLPVILLDPGPEDYVLDMCAAPGSKATQIAARMGNQGELVCIEAIRGRFFKLKTVTQLMGATNITAYLKDARKYRSGGRLFNKILVDAPCSSEGRFKESAPKTFAYWSPRKIKEMAHKQKGLLLSASRLLQPGGTLIYSTCTFAPEENEAVVQWVLKKTDGALTLEDAHVDGVGSYPTVPEWGKKTFGGQIIRCLRVLPSQKTEGFFIAKFKKNH